MARSFDLPPGAAGDAPAAVRLAPPPRIVSQPMVIAVALGWDVAAVLIAGLFAHSHWVGPADAHLAVALALVTAVFAGVMKARWAYTIAALSAAGRQVYLLGLSLFVALGVLIIVNVLADVPIEPLRVWLFGWFGIAWGCAALSRPLLARMLAGWERDGRLARRTVIVGGGKPTQDLIDRLERSGSSALKILGIFDDRDKNRSPEQIGAYHKLGRFADLEAFCREQRVDLLIIALPTTAEERILHILKMLWVLPVDVRIAAHGAKLKLRSRAYAYIGDVPFLPVFDKPMSDWNVALKTIEDRVLATLGLIALSPLLALIALAVKLDSRGPVFFRQQRYGFNNEPIGVYKFRSMYVDQCDAAAAKLVTKGDPRVTRVGAFIRKTSLDELPQLINVLKGELSLVGPRPHAMQAKAEGRIYDQVVDGYFARHKVLPGITGWAQVNGWRGETDVIEKIEQRVAHDLYYIENWSTWLDLRILMMTPLSLVTTKNAY